MNAISVLDVKTGLPVEGATVTLDGNPLGETGSDGGFAVPAQGGMLKITHVNYEPEQFDIAGAVNQVIRLVPRSGDLPEIVITAIKKKENIFFLLLLLLAVALFYSYKKGLLK